MTLGQFRAASRFSLKRDGKQGDRCSADRNGGNKYRREGLAR